MKEEAWLRLQMSEALDLGLTFDPESLKGAGCAEAEQRLFCRMLSL